MSRAPLDFLVLGSGSFLPKRGRKSSDPVRNPPGYALRRGDQVVLFDLGYGNLHQLVRGGFEPEQISHVFVSHRHPDHVGDLSSLLFYFRFDGKPRRGRLRLCGPRGFKGFMARLERAFHPWLKPRGYQLFVDELEERDVVRGEGWRVVCREVPHSTESLAYRFESPEGTVCYTGDTAWEPGLARFAAEADLLVVECALADGQRAEGHMCPREAAALARASGARRTILTHLSPASERGARRRARPPRLRLARDLMRIRV